MRGRMVVFAAGLAPAALAGCSGSDDGTSTTASTAAVGVAPVPGTAGTSAGSVVTVEPMTDGPPTQEQLDAARITLEACALVGTDDVSAAVGTAVAEAFGTGVPGRTDCRYEDSAGDLVVTVALLTEDIPAGDDRPREVFDGVASSPGVETSTLDGGVDALWLDGSLYALVGSSLVTVDVETSTSGDERRRSAEALAAVAITRL